ncbi:putative cobalt transporter subunit (CbtB) [Pseudoruegeria aquimaris]|uniref:Putative cobalt transporter subunit (CbtB) n=1 Tax=Pseudoruegeria aquimaris TaxID=393663 RepID=A0A1Y5S0T3_9RHOB|nr:CbtB domain-containing protein [Pseudoruegeria aquimaris]SLN29898.1 putative cobalt transporter subunit (CbtB) [Pseudoruegeria aquimaris]
MTTLTQTQAETRAGLLPILGAAAFGIGLLFFTGFAQATVFHDTAHDTRHAIAFPCH